jgi:multiple sugar transport system ATP-binding protein
MGSPAMNLKTVPLTESGATFSSLLIPLSREQVAAAQGGNGKVTIGFRPEAADLVSEGEGAMPIVVDLVEDLGSDANVYGHADLDGGSERFVVRTDRRHMPSMGETVYVKPQANGIHVFNAGSGERV